MSNASLLRHWHDAAKILEEIWSRIRGNIPEQALNVLILVVVEISVQAK